MIGELAARGIVKFGNFRLSSGAESPYYVDLRGVLGHPDLLRWVVGEYMRALRRVEFDVLAGIATGGVPYASIAGYLLGVPVAYVREAAKGHGLGRRVEGAPVGGRRVALLDDVLTTGASALEAARAVASEGGAVAAVVVFLDREQCGARRLGDAGVEVVAAYRMSELLEGARELIPRDQYEAAVGYLRAHRC